MAVDLHIHTTCSDGSYSPEAIVDRAIKKGLTAIAITDHDTIAGIVPAINYAANNLTVIPGVEISSAFNTQDLHILGYNIDLNDLVFLERLTEIRNARIIRTKKILLRLKELGLKFDDSELLTQLNTTTICRSHIAMALYNAGVVANKQAAFDKYLGFGKPAYIARNNISPTTAIQWITAAKGVAVWAHPFKTIDLQFLETLIAAGLAGIEVYHPSHSNKQIKQYTAIAKKYNLIITGGSDFHGSNPRYNSDLGDVSVGNEVISQLMPLSFLGSQ